MKQGIKDAYHLLMSVPLVVVWLIMGLTLFLYGGPKMFDKFIIHWNNMANDKS